MKYFRRFLYVFYYLIKEDKRKFINYINYINRNENIPRLSLIMGMFISSLKYNISLQEYFLFRFYNLSKREKETYAGTGTMYEYQLVMNPIGGRAILEDKLLFLKGYAPFIKHKFLALGDLTIKSETLAEILKNQSGKIVLKDSKGQCGDGIEVRNTVDFNQETLVERLKETGNDFVEEFVQQHDHLDKLSPSGLNTIRVITQLNKDNKVEILGARLRITINSSIDNLAAGNIASPINIETGRVEGSGVYSDITKSEERIHPITGMQIDAFQIPFWKESLHMVKDAALLHPENRSIGWDVAITNNGPELIEGNHDWCKLLWQLPVKRGLKPKLEKHKEQYLEIIR